jgi:hypothetical protein
VIELRTIFSFRRLIVIVPVVILVFGILSCSKTPIRPKHPTSIIDTNTSHRGVYVIDEGNFNWGNASVTYIDLTDTSVSQNIYASANHDAPLGDVAEGMKIFNGYGYIVVNNSNKIEVVSLPSFVSYKTITGFNSPRDIAFIDSSKAYVTNLLGNISVVDLKSFTITKSIPVPNWTESIAKFGNKVFVTCLGKYTAPTSDRRAKIIVINSDLDKIMDSVASGKDPVGIVVDKRDKIWVLCTGGVDNFEPPTLIRVNPDLLIAEKVFTFPDQNSAPSRLSINTQGDTLYFLDNGVVQMPVTLPAIPATRLIPANGRLFYGLGIDPFNGNIFVSDAVDYVQAGKVYRYNQLNGTLLNSYTAGTIPGAFCFPKQTTSGKTK